MVWNEKKDFSIEITKDDEQNKQIVSIMFTFSILYILMMFFKSHVYHTILLKYITERFKFAFWKNVVTDNHKIRISVKFWY